MKKQILSFLTVLILSNAAAGIALYYVYFPWSTDIDYEAAKEEVRNDLLELNVRFSQIDYQYQKSIADKASLELKREIKALPLEELDLDKEQRTQFKLDRYMIDMEAEDGPIGILKTNSDNYLVIGPYYSQYDAINLRDLFAYFIFLLVFNGLCVWGFIQYLKIRFMPASIAIDRVSKTLKLHQDDHILTNVMGNTPTLVDTIFELQNDHEKNIQNQQDLMHAVAHEFRGPMARISFATDLLLSDKKPNNSAQLKTDVESSLEELDALVKEVLDYSRLKDGHQVLKPESFNILDVISSARKKVELVYPNKNFQVEINPTSGFECYLDQKLIERALLNLIRNAAKFSFANVLVKISKTSDEIIVQVEDDGNGVPPGKRLRIFEPFTRLDHSRSRDSGGAGLGLAIVKGIALRHNGHIEVQDSDDLGGANFILKLPISIEV